MRKFLRTPIITALFLCAALLLPASSARGAAGLEAELAAQERARVALRQKILWYNETAGEKLREAMELRMRISFMEKNAELARQQIEVLESQLDRLRESISALDIEIAGMSRQFDMLMNEFRLRVLNIHKYGAREELNLLLAAENAHDAVASAYLLGRLARHDRSSIDGLADKMTGLKRGRHSAESNKAQLMARADELSLQREKYGELIERTNAMLAEVHRERLRAEAAAKETERASREIDRSIAELARVKKAGRQDAPVVSAFPVYPVLERGARLEWPVRGAVVSGFGPGEHPVSKMKFFNSGIDISAPPGTLVRAAGPGRVLYEGLLDGFGHVVIIDHGSGLSTVYANLASARVREKDAVLPGAVIGAVGKGSGAEAYGLHFEVRAGDAAENPLDYLPEA